MNLPYPGTTDLVDTVITAKGISIILCCYNSAARLNPTLEALSQLERPGFAPVEIILVDNASSDSTVSTAKRTWQSLSTGIPLKLVYEPLQGLIHARQAGIRHANHELLVFCDDDNLLNPCYLKQAFKHFERRPKLAALGGFGIPFSEQPQPAWFESFASSFATGSQRITSEMGRTLNLYGAGLVVRKSALLKLYSAGYRPLLIGRNGTALSGAEDTEMTYALAIAGYELDFDDQMTFHHRLPPSRLQAGYMKRLFLSSAQDGPLRNLYHAYATHRTIPALMKYWPFHLLIALIRIPKYLIKPPKPGYRNLYFKWNMRYLKSLFTILPHYYEARKNIGRIPAPASAGLARSESVAESQSYKR